VGRRRPREEIDRLHEHPAAADPINGGVIGVQVPDQQIRVRRGGKLREKRGKVELTDLAGSTGARRERRERLLTGFPICHAAGLYGGGRSSYEKPKRLFASSTVVARATLTMAARSCRP
jgi:hypothetical protein